MLYKYKVCNAATVSIVQLLSVSAKVNGTKSDIVGLSPNMTLTALQCREGGMNVSIMNACSVGDMHWASLWVSASAPTASVSCTAFNRLNVSFGIAHGVSTPTQSPTSRPSIKPSRRPSSRPSGSPSNTPLVKKPTYSPSKQPFDATKRPTVMIVSSTSSPPVSSCQIVVRYTIWLEISFT